MVKEAAENKLKVQELKRRLDGTELDLSLMQIESVPVTEIASLKKVTSLDLSCNMIVCLPDTFSVLLQSLTKLDLSKNKLSELPKDIGKLKNLQRLDLFQNFLVEIPASFAQLSNLKWLDLKDNPLGPSYSRIVGDCLDDKQCRQCAIKVVSAIRVAAAKQQEQQLNILKEQKKLEAKKLAKERKLLEKKRREKKTEKDRRRREWEAQQQGDDEDENNQEVDDDEASSPATSAPCHAVQRSSGGLRNWLMALTVLGVAGLLYFHCSTQQSDYWKVFNAKSIDESFKIVQTAFTKLARVGEEQAVHLRIWLAHTFNSVQEYYYNVTKGS